MTDLQKLRQQNLEGIFNPASVAIVGTNNVKGTVPHDIIDNIIESGFHGKVFPVSPGEKEVKGIETYKYVIDIPEKVDLAIIVFPSSVCHLAMEQCGQKGIKSVIIISAGFKEVGEAGLQKEKQIVEIARKYDISFIGPNCLGVINADPGVKLSASFAKEMPGAGNIGFLSQSGALCTAVLDYAIAKNIGFSKFVSFGNKADISEIDLLYYLMNDEETKVILMYLEEVTDGKALMNAAKDAIEKHKKPVLVIKSGRTKEGASAAASHTGSLAGQDEVCDAAFAQAGIIRCNNIEEMFNKAIAFAYQPAPKSNKIAIITNAGGPGVLATDAAITRGLRLAQFSDETTKILKKNLPATANTKNPVDVIGDAKADRYKVAIEAAFKDDDVDGVFVILTPQSMTDIDTIATELTNMAKGQTKPIYTSFMGEKEVASGIKILQNHKIPHYILPESMCAAFHSVFRFYKNQKRPVPEEFAFENIQHDVAKKLMNSFLSNGKTYITENETIELLAAYGIETPRGKLVQSAEEAVKAAGEIGYPVVMKVVSDQIVHKSDVKGIALNLDNEYDVEDAYAGILKNVSQAVPDATIKGILVTKMIQEGEEVILGIKRDPAFGPVIMFGLGGVFVEVFKDISFGVAPLNHDEAKSMIEQTRAFKILQGTRGKAPKDIDKIVETIIRLGQLALDYPQIEELDVNPLFVMDKGKGNLVGDARMFIRKSDE